MIRTMLFPLIKRYYKLFLSMIGISVLAVSLLSAIPSAVKNTNDAFAEFKANCGYADCTLQTELAPRRYADKLIEIDGVEEVNQRIGIAGYMKAPNGNISTSMICSYLDADYYKRYIISETKENADMINVSIERRYAENNEIEAGQTIKLYIYGTETEVFIKSIVFTPETIYVTSNPFIMSDNTCFGYIFIEDSDLADAVKKSERGNIDLLWQDFFGGIVRNGKLRYSNQVLIKCKEGADPKEVLEKCKAQLSKNVNITSGMTKDKTSSEAYMEKFRETFGMVAWVFPLFFYLIMLFVVVMFLNQMVLYMTRDIGILRAIGVSRNNILGMLSCFSLCMSLCAFILGVLLGTPLCRLGTHIFLDVYQIPRHSSGLDISVIIFTFIVTVVVGQLAAIISGLKANHITPKDAISNNESKRKDIPEKISKLLNRLPSEKKLGVCIAIQNPRRVIVSIFSVMASFMILFSAISFKYSKESVLRQTLDERYKFDVSFLSSDENTDKVIKKLNGLDSVEKIEVIEFLDCMAKSDKAELEIHICGLEKDQEMFLIPDEKGSVGDVIIEDDGIWLNCDQAKELGVSVGDTILIDDVPVVISGLTYEYMNKISAVSQKQMEAISKDYMTGYFMKVSDIKELGNFLVEQKEACVISAFDEIDKDLRLRIEPLEFIVILLICFALLMCIIILVMMAQASLLEQQRLVCTMRVLGFSTGDISRMWLRQETVYTVIGIILGIPAGVAVFRVIMHSIINDAWSFPMELRPLIILIVILVILATVAVTHFLSMRITRKWNLAESTKDRE